MFTVYYTDKGQVMFRDLNGNGLDQGVDFVICEEGGDDGFGQIFEFDNVITDPEEGVFVREHAGSSNVFKLTVSEYGAIGLEKTNKTFEQLLKN